MSLMLMLVGAAGIAGAIETGHGMVPAIIISVIGIAGLWYQGTKEGGAKGTKHRSSNNNNCHSYPSCLDSRRRA